MSGFDGAGASSPYLSADASASSPPLRAVTKHSCGRCFVLCGLLRPLVVTIFLSCTVWPVQAMARYICIWIWAGKHCATWHVSGYIPIRCASRQKAGNIMIKTKKHALFMCPCMQMCSLRLQFADLFHDLPLADKISVNQTGAFYFSQACPEDVFKIFQRQTNDSYLFISELMDVFCMAGVHQQPEQSNYLAEV